MIYNNTGDGMQEFVNEIVNSATNILQSYGPLAGCLLILLESIIPILPLAVFIAFNMFAFGNFGGFIISWLSTMFGCLMSYFLFKYFGKKIDKSITKRPKIDKVRKAIKNVKFSNLVLIMALPFTPAFLVNIASGLAHVDFKKFLASLFIGKAVMVYFWGFISKSLIESITDLKTLLIISCLLLISYILSKLVNKKFKIE